MKLIDADALIKRISRNVHQLYDKTTEEWKEHIDLEDNKSIFMFSMEQYVKVKFAYNWLKGELQSEKPVDVEKEIRKKTLDEVYSIAMNESHDTLIEWLQENIID